MSVIVGRISLSMELFLTLVIQMVAILGPVSSSQLRELFEIEPSLAFDFEVLDRPTTVVITMFNCPPWDIYADTITVYSTILFLTLNLDTFATPVGSV